MSEKDMYERYVTHAGADRAPTVRLDPRVRDLAWHFIKVNKPDTDALHQAALAFKLTSRIADTINQFVRNELPR